MTKVQFYQENDGEIFAFFPNENYHEKNTETKVCYAQIGQHSPCTLSYAKGCKRLNSNNRLCLPLKKELQSIGYVIR